MPFPAPGLLCQLSPVPHPYQNAVTLSLCNTSVSQTWRMRTLTHMGGGGRAAGEPFQMLLLCHFCNADLEDEDLDEDMGGGGRAAGEPGSASPGGGRRNRYDDFGGDLSDEMDDFIVDGEDGDRRRARRRRDARVAQAAGLSTAAVQVRYVDIC
jgi:hypothetical protein